MIPRLTTRFCTSRINRRLWTRPFSADTSTSSAFDRDLKSKQRDNAARAHLAWRGGPDVDGSGKDEAVDYNYFREEMAYRLVDRLDDIKRDEG